MKKSHVAAAVLSVTLAAGGVAARNWYLSITKGYPLIFTLGQPSPEFWAPAVAAFKLADDESFPAKGQILFIGSSSFARWKTLGQDMAPLQTLNRGFGGSNLDHMSFYAEQLIFPYEPRAIVIYAGENDFRGFFPDSPEQVFADFEALDALLKARLPETPVHYLSIKPTISDWHLWPRMQEANRLIRQYTEADERLHFIDISTVMLGADGAPRPEIFVEDKIHFTLAGYAAWTGVIKPILLEQYGEQP